MIYTVNREEFKKRKKLTINPSVITLTDYQIKKTITYDSDMNSDFSDLRFTTFIGVNIPYWIESKTDGVTADVWLKIPLITTTEGAEIWMYYGNSNASSVSNITDTMVFGDDFSGSSIDTGKWTTIGSPVISGGELTLNADDHITSIDTFGFETILTSRSKTDEQDISFVGYFFNQDNRMLLYNSDSVTNDDFDNIQFTTRKNGSAEVQQNDGWHDFRNIYYQYTIKRISTSLIEYSQNNYNNSYTNSVYIPTNDMKIKMYVWDSSQASILICDWVFIRKYTTTEPTWATDGLEEPLKQLHSTINFRLIIQKPSGNNDIYYPQIISGSCTSVYPFAVPTARFIVASNSTISTSAYLSPVRDDDIVRFQVNHKYLVGEKDVWIDVFEGRVNGIGSIFNSNENSTTIKCIGHGESLKYTFTPTTVGHTAKTTGFILETLMPAMARISDDDTLLDIAGSTSISQFDLKEDSQKIMDVVRDLESLELYGYIFRLQPEYDSDGVLTSVEPVWEEISSTATDKLIINESAQSFISASFESTISKMRNRFTIYGSDDPQVSATVEDTALQATYDVREQVEVDKTIATAAMCANIATAALTRWKNPIITGTVTIRGNPYIKVGDRVTCNIPSIVINGEPIDDTYLIYRVTHNVNNGYTTTLVLGEIDMSASELITSFVLGNRRNNLNGID